MAGSRSSGVSTNLPDWFFVIKLSGLGAVQWQKIFNPDDGTQGANSIDQTADGGYVLAGIGYQKFLVAKLDSVGTIPGCPNIWDYTLPNPFVSIITAVPSIAEASVTLSQGNPSVVATDVTVTEHAYCSLGGVCAAQTVEGSSKDSSGGPSSTLWTTFCVLLLVVGAGWLVARRVGE